MNSQLHRVVTAAAVPIGLALLGLSILTPPAKAETLTTCEYGPSLGFEDPLNSGDAGTGQAAITVTNDALSISDRSMGRRLSEVVLDLSDFSRINAGTRLPREDCDR